MERLYILVVALIGCLCCVVGASDVYTLDEYNFESETKYSVGSNEDWFVEFYAPWCGHCKKLSPIWEQLATKLKGQVKVGKVDATENNDLAERFGVRGYPSLFFISGGKVIKHSGSRDLESLFSYATDEERTGDAVSVRFGADKSGKPRKSKIAAFVKMIIADFYVAIEEHRLALAIVCGTGVLLGCVVGRMLFKRPSKPKKE